MISIPQEGGPLAECDVAAGNAEEIGQQFPD